MPALVDTAATALLPAARRTYRTIVADPPWDCKSDKGWNGFSGVHRHGKRCDTAKPQYDVMPLADIKAMGPMVDALAQPTCSLFLWTIAAYLPSGDALDVARAWGFPRCVAVFNWIKSEAGAGMGKWCRNDAEYVLWCIRGEAKPPEKAESNNFRGHREARHSVKPQSFYDLIERISPGPYLDMFGGRGTLRFDWDFWGNGK